MKVTPNKRLKRIAEKRRKASYDVRLGVLEKRLTDIQDVVISLDDRLKRFNR